VNYEVGIKMKWPVGLMQTTAEYLARHRIKSEIRKVANNNSEQEI